MARGEQLEFAGRADMSQPSPSHNLSRFSGTVAWCRFGSRSSAPRLADDRS
jgi:hypothetical protein